MLAATKQQIGITYEVETLMMQDFQRFFYDCQTPKEPSEWKRPKRPISELLQVLTLALLTENSARNWTELHYFQQANYTKLQTCVPDYGKIFAPGIMWTKLNAHLKMEMFVPSFVSWTERIAEASDYQVEPLTICEADLVRTLTNRQSWRVLGIIRFWINKNPEFKSACCSHLNFLA
ncbi:hypothetical protein NIES4071_36180 [Calothrix sp. NIES-4071]|nr:hypothetical protein NIES4071_36180 [Calothrix sp. NIES-4071]BAZ57937.1 hypothetical protein NIES4105_36110 [Calothrix sp. NIES-4105]